MTDIFVSPKQNKENFNPLSNGRRHLHQIGIFSTFSQNPDGVSFQTQKSHERIILFLRAHIITNLSWIAFTIVLLLLPFVINWLSPLFGMNLLFLAGATRFILVFNLFYYLLVFSYIFISFLHWFYNVFIVTSERVVDIDYSNIVVHNIAVTGLSHVQDVNYTQSGFIATFFNYGHIFVQTAGDEMNFEAVSIPKPREATHIIGDLIGIK